MAKKIQKDEILNYDLSKATPEEIFELKEGIDLILDHVADYCYQLLDQKNLFGCLHEHIRVCLELVQMEMPCPDCEEKINEAAKDLH